MAYYKVLIKEEFVYEVLVRATDASEAKKEVLSSEHSWGDHIHHQCYAYETVELGEIE